LDIRKPKELKRVSQWLALFLCLGGIYGGLRGVYIFRGYATPPPRVRKTSGAVEVGSISVGGAVTGEGEARDNLHHLDCGGFGRGNYCYIPKSITAL
jgi:hypothetical protein